jgi:hypothetical protein
MLYGGRQPVFAPQRGPGQKYSLHGTETPLHRSHVKSARNLYQVRSNYYQKITKDQKVRLNSLLLRQEYVKWLKFDLESNHDKYRSSSKSPDKYSIPCQMQSQELYLSDSHQIYNVCASGKILRPKDGTE